MRSLYQIFAAAALCPARRGMPTFYIAAASLVIHDRQ
jgi:hypothetical protein